MINDQNFDWTLCCLQSQPELFLQRREYRGNVGIGSRRHTLSCERCCRSTDWQRCKFQPNIKESFEICLVNNGTINLPLHQIDECGYWNSRTGKNHTSWRI